MTLSCYIAHLNWHCCKKQMVHSNIYCFIKHLYLQRRNDFSTLVQYSQVHTKFLKSYFPQVNWTTTNQKLVNDRQSWRQEPDKQFTFFKICSKAFHLCLIYLSFFLLCHLTSKILPNLLFIYHNLHIVALKHSFSA